MIHPQRLRDQRAARRRVLRGIARMRREERQPPRVGWSNLAGLALVAAAVLAGLTWTPRGVVGPEAPAEAAPEAVTPAGVVGPGFTFAWRPQRPRAWQVVVVNRAMVEVARSATTDVGASSLPGDAEWAAGLVPGVPYLWQVVTADHGVPLRTGLREFELAAH